MSSFFEQNFSVFPITNLKKKKKKDQLLNQNKFLYNFWEICWPLCMYIIVVSPRAGLYQASLQRNLNKNTLQPLLALFQLLFTTSKKPVF